MQQLDNESESNFVKVFGALVKAGTMRSVLWDSSNKRESSRVVDPMIPAIDDISMY